MTEKDKSIQLAVEDLSSFESDKDRTTVSLAGGGWSTEVVQDAGDEVGLSDSLFEEDLAWTIGIVTARALLVGTLPRFAGVHARLTPAVVVAEVVRVEGTRGWSPHSAR